jgi:Skp family chaperone for outer membrane proteins
MSEPKIGLRAIVLACIVLCIFATLQGASAGQDKSGLKVASVDVQRLIGEYNLFNKNIKTLLEKDQANLNLLRAMQQHPLLPEAENRALADLMVAETTQQGGLNPAQKEQKQKLLDKSKALSQEFIELQQKKVVDLQPQDKDKLNAYFGLQTSIEARLTKLQTELNEAIRAEASKNEGAANKTIRETITKFAKDKGYNIVFSNQVAWYAENDITDGVLKELNK